MNITTLGKKVGRYFPGLMLTGGIGLFSKYLEAYLTIMGFSSLTLAIVIGILIGNTASLSPSFQLGIKYSMRKVLRLSIVLLGFRMTFQDIEKIGLSALVADLFVVVSTFFFAVLVAKKCFRLDDTMSYLIAAGSSICGASAVLAASPIVKSENHQNAVAIASVTLFGTISMFVYPVLYKNGWLIGLDDSNIGIFLGATIHEVGQVISAGFSISEETGKTATFVKLTRVMFLAPTLISLGWFLNRNRFLSGEENRIRVEKPWFIFAFILVIAFNSSGIVPVSISVFLSKIGLFFMLVAIAGMGLETNLQKVKKVGLKAMYVSVLIFFFLLGSGWWISFLGSRIFR
ncbi:YeiH family putative sulfate export transporter [Leptospira sp. 201903070]|uniref:YeiH family putative sulfate export transporter n=1 Tax=Leptospira ainlahdjerensis TaxID=2810033 RepID=A0ABS2UDP6_9LEPT|nr:YeiH family protein [Leptospira ainlahdjerensis]MBM9578500.1 YeiH family putative sulfate export transporter [Leptospira ainlahdjerensis]